jgi:hypothetical protein
VYGFYDDLKEHRTELQSKLPKNSGSKASLTRVSDIPLLANFDPLNEIPFRGG